MCVRVCVCGWMGGNEMCSVWVVGGYGVTGGHWHGVAGRYRVTGGYGMERLMPLDSGSGKWGEVEREGLWLELGLAVRR